MQISTRDKVGIIGKNGSGKSTILKMIVGLETANNGNITVRNDSSIGYMRQIPEYPDNYTVLDVLKSIFKRELEIADEMRKLEDIMSKCDNSTVKSVLKEYSTLCEHFEHLGGYNIDENINKICTGLDISETFRTRLYSTLSGGEKTTVQLCQLLIKSPDILLLDEPTNHLDIDAVEWLEDYLNKYKGTVLIVSHDRYFLDKTVHKIIEIENGISKLYHGNYSDFSEQKEINFNIQTKDYKDQHKIINHLE